MRTGANIPDFRQTVQTVFNCSKDLPGTLKAAINCRPPWVVAHETKNILQYSANNQ
jgi:hypothetical protein